MPKKITREECNEEPEKIYCLTTGNCIVINGKCFKDRLKAQIESYISGKEKIIHFDPVDLIQKGFGEYFNENMDNKILENLIENFSKTQIYKNTQEDFQCSLKTYIEPLKTLADKAKKTIKFNKRYIDENHKEYCNNAHLNISYNAESVKDRLLTKPIIKKDLRVNFSYFKSSIQGQVFNTRLFDDITEDGKCSQWKVDLIANKHNEIRNMSTNYDRMTELSTKETEDSFTNNINLEWFNEMNKYIITLSIPDLFALKAYTFHGDVLINNFLRNTFDVKLFKDHSSIYDNPKQTIYFPLFFPLLEMFYNKPDILKNLIFGGSQQNPSSNRQSSIDDERFQKIIEENERQKRENQNRRRQDRENRTSGNKPLNIQKFYNNIDITNTINILHRLILNNKGDSSFVDFWSKKLTLYFRELLYYGIVRVYSYIDDNIIIEAITNLKNTIDRIILGSPKTKTKMIVYRGDKDDSYFSKDKNFSFKPNGLISTSASFNIASAFTSVHRKMINKKGKYPVFKKCCLNEITILPNSNILFIGGVSSVPHEIEFILGSNTTYLIREFRKEKYYTLNNDLICESPPNAPRIPILTTKLVVINPSPKNTQKLVTGSSGGSSKVKYEKCAYKINNKCVYKKNNKYYIRERKDGVLVYKKIKM